MNAGIVDVLYVQLSMALTIENDLRGKEIKIE